MSQLDYSPGLEGINAGVSAISHIDTERNVLTYRGYNVQDLVDHATFEEVAWAENQRQVGRSVELMVAEGEGRKDAATHRMSGRARDNRLVHFTPEETTPRPGDIVTVTVTRGAPHYLLSDAAPLSVRRTRAGDAWEAAAAAPVPLTLPAEPPAGAPVLLGMPAGPPRS